MYTPSDFKRLRFECLYCMYEYHGYSLYIHTEHPPPSASAGFIYESLFILFVQLGFGPSGSTYNVHAVRVPRLQFIHTVYPPPGASAGLIYTNAVLYRLLNCDSVVRRTGHYKLVAPG